MPLLNKPSAERNSGLRKAWDAYGHNVPWDDLIACRFRGGAQGGYVLLAWQSSNDENEMEYADLAFDGREWQMQNDGSDPISKSDWAKIKMPSDCDWHVRPDEDQRTV